MPAAARYLDKNGFIHLSRPLAPGVTRLRPEDPTFSDLAGVLAGVKPVTYTDCLPESFPALRELCEKLKLRHLLPEKIFHKRGGHFGAEKQKLMVLIGKDLRTLKAAARAWSVSTTEAPWALMLGYPQCCVEAFIRWFRDGDDKRRARDEIIRRIFSNTQGPKKLDFRLNNVWNYFSRVDFNDPSDCLRHSRILNANKDLSLPSLHVISWHPCSYNCAASRIKADAIFSFLERHSKTYAGGLRERLARPVLFFGKYEFAVLNAGNRGPGLGCSGVLGPRSLLNPKIRSLADCCDTLIPGPAGLEFRRRGKKLFSAGSLNPLLLNFSKDPRGATRYTPEKL